MEGAHSLTPAAVASFTNIYQDHPTGVGQILTIPESVLNRAVPSNPPQLHTAWNPMHGTDSAIWGRAASRS